MTAVMLIYLSMPEIIACLCVVLILFASDGLLRYGLGFGDPGDPGLFKRAVQSVLDELGRDAKFHQPDYTGEVRGNQLMKNNPASLVLWIAQGFGIGKISFAAGTFGSLVGLLWFAILLATRSYWIFLAAGVLGIGLSIWLCGEAEKILEQTDPGSIVLDEIIALPICFLSWVSWLYVRDGVLPPPEYFFSDQQWLRTFAVFAAFRFFDIVKPWPVRQCQSLHGGLGVTMDDVAAALYVNGLNGLIWILLR
jgi:phosphatidylglycerophosphatase A